MPVPNSPADSPSRGLPERPHEVDQGEAGVAQRGGRRGRRVGDLVAPPGRPRHPRCSRASTADRRFGATCSRRRRPPPRRLAARSATTRASAHASAAPLPPRRRVPLPHRGARAGGHCGGAVGAVVGDHDRLARGSADSRARSSDASVAPSEASSSCAGITTAKRNRPGSASRRRALARGRAGRRAEQPEQIARSRRERAASERLAVAGVIRRAPRRRAGRRSRWLRPAVRRAHLGGARDEPLAERRIVVQRRGSRARGRARRPIRTARSSDRGKYASTARVRDTTAGRRIAMKSNILLQCVRSRKRVAAHGDDADVRLGDRGHQLARSAPSRR